MPTFIYLPTFDRIAAQLRMTDEDLQAIETELAVNPRRGAVIPGAGGARKLRVPLAGRGKSGGARAVYIYVEVKGRIYFVLLYPKNVKGNLTEAEKKALRTLIPELEGER